MLSQEIIREATRLTRAGHLVEATALLQRMLRGGGASETSGSRLHVSPARLDPPTIDLKASVVEEREMRRTARPSSAPAGGPSAARFVGLNNISGFGIGDLDRRAPLPADIAPVGGRFIRGSFASAAGRRTYKLFIPSGYQGHPLPLIVMLHGCTQSPDDFAAGTRMNFLAEEMNCFVAYPEQPIGANQSKCWNWFRPGDQRRGGGEPSLIAGITRQIMSEYSVDAKRVYVGGLSAGGAAAAVMGATYPDLYAAIGVHSGLACGAARDLPSALVAMRQGGGNNTTGEADSFVPTIVFHGDRDTMVHPNNADRIVQRFGRETDLTTRVVQGSVPNGYAYTRTILIGADGRAISEHWNIHGAGHAWSGGSPAGSYTDPLGPDATGHMVRFFLEHSLKP